MKTIAVIGGGAAGLMAAVTAAKAGAKVMVLEHQPSCGKKLLATGNGRCNLTNTQMRPDAYRSQIPQTVKKVLHRFSVEDTLCFFSDMGLYIREQNGWVYPYSRQAKTVLYLMLSEAERLGAEIKTQVEIADICPERAGWKLNTNRGTFHTDAVILAAGSKASNLPGADGSGYDLAESLGHKILPVLPALVPLVGEGKYFSQWAGLRMDGAASLRVDGKYVFREAGEIQLTDYGVSGIPVFQLSRYAVESVHQKKDTELYVDFFPDMDTKCLEHLLRAQKKKLPFHTWTEILRGIFPEKFCSLPVNLAGRGRDSEMPRRIARQIKHWRIPIRGWKDYTYAQVCMGGVDLRQVDPYTLESRLHKSFYFAGEILDVDGACGGYNLQWAWSSGAAAAMACTSHEERKL